MHCSVKQPRVTPAAAISQAMPSIWSVFERTAPTVGLGLAKAIWINLMADILPDPGHGWQMDVLYTSVMSLHVALVEPEIHWNTGNVGRSCLAAGARLHLVEPLGFFLDEREVRRAGLDYWSRVDPRIWRSWAELEERISDLGEPYFFSTEGTRSFWDVQYPERTVLVFGKESVGLAPEIRERWRDRMVSIPMLDPEIRSLNLSTSVALALWEVLRQRRAAADPPENQQT